MRSQKLRTYHTVCPVHSYFLEQFCYNEPVNEAILAIFPRYNSENASLMWEVTLVNSSLIDTQLVKFLTDSWGSDDTILHNFLKNDD